MLISTSIGAALLATVLFDIIVTALTMRSAGPLTSWFMQGVWRSALLVSRSGAHAFLLAAGNAIVAGTILLWALLLWLGWSLIFLGTEGGVVNSQTGDPAGTWDTVYFAGFTLFTLGLGDFRPDGAPWQILTGLCVANGLLVLTMSVTYIVPVLSAAAGRRQLAAQIDCIGSTPEGIIRFCWNGSDFRRLEEELSSLTPSIVLQSQQHLAYPTLHYFHSADARTSLPLRIAALDEAITILVHSAPSGTGPEASTVNKARRAIGFLLEVMDAAHIKPSEEAPPPPAETQLRFDELPELDLEALAAGLKAYDDRRSLLQGWVNYGGRRWAEIWATADPDSATPR